MCIFHHFTEFGCYYFAEFHQLKLHWSIELQTCHYTTNMGQTQPHTPKISLRMKLHQIFGISQIFGSQNEASPNIWHFPNIWWSE